MYRNMLGKWRLSWLTAKLRRINPYLGSFITVAIFLGAALSLPQQTGQWSASVIFLMAVFVSASLWGFRQGIIVSFVAGLAYDFFFIPPLYSLDIDHWRNALSLLIFVLIAASASLLAETLNRRTCAARRDEVIAKRLYSLSRRLGEADDITMIAETVVASVGVAVGAKTALLLPMEGGLVVAAAHPTGASLDRAELEAARQAHERNMPNGGPVTQSKGITCVLLPMDTSIGNEAVLIVGETSRRPGLVPHRMRIIEMLAGQASSALKRSALQKRAEEARVAAEAERLRASLLTSISHDLKSPLAIILGSASSLQDLGASLDSSAAQDLLHSILEEGERLNQFIANLLDMSRVESEAVRPKRQLADLNDIIGSALQHTGRALSGHRTVLHVPDNIPSIEIDPVLMEKALINILENAGNYTPPGTQITLTVSQDSESIAIQICDEGPGIPATELPRLFDKFYRGATTAWKPAGTGLGLAISRGFLEAMGGAIAASNRQGKSGAVFTIKLPVRLTKAHRSQAARTAA
ncbi:MAG: ATP-binding protein [Rhodomicrobium sp.]